MAWKNILRNKRRSLLTGGALFLVTFFVICYMATEYGSMDDMKMNIVHNKFGVIRVRNPEFTKNERINPLNLNIADTPEVIKKLEAFPGIVRAEPKITTVAAVYQDGDTKSVNLLGIDFVNSNYFKDKDNQLVSGSLSEVMTARDDGAAEKTGRRTRNCVVSRHFANAFGLNSGDKFTIMTRTARNGTNGCTLRVSAVVQFADGDLGGDYVFMDFGELSSLLRMGGNATEILVFTEDWTDDAMTHRIADELSASPEFAGFEITPWLSGNSFMQLLEFTDLLYFVYAVIFFLLSAIVIFNSSMMSVMERKKEIGSLLSLGMGPHTVVILFLLETVIISAIAATSGALVASVLVNITGHTGINLAGSGFAAMDGFSIKMILYPNLSFGRYFEFAFTGFAMSVIASVIPSRMALSVQPAEALRSES